MLVNTTTPSGTNLTFAWSFIRRVCEKKFTSCHVPKTASYTLLETKGRQKSCIKTNENQTVGLLSGDELNTCVQFSLECMHFVKCFLFYSLCLADSDVHYTANCTIQTVLHTVTKYDVAEKLCYLNKGGKFR